MLEFHTTSLVVDGHAIPDSPGVGVPADLHEHGRFQTVIRQCSRRLPVFADVADVADWQRTPADDAIVSSTIGVRGVRDIDWQNRPTFQQVVQLPPADDGGGDGHPGRGHGPPDDPGPPNGRGGGPPDGAGPFSHRPLVI